MCSRKISHSVGPRLESKACGLLALSLVSFGFAGRLKHIMMQAGRKPNSSLRPTEMEFILAGRVSVFFISEAFLVDSVLFRAAMIDQQHSFTLLHLNC